VLLSWFETREDALLIMRSTSNIALALRSPRAALARSKRMTTFPDALFGTLKQLA